METKLNGRSLEKSDEHVHCFQIMRYGRLWNGGIDNWEQNYHCTQLCTLTDYIENGKRNHSKYNLKNWYKILKSKRSWTGCTKETWKEKLYSFSLEFKINAFA